jgi:hypothetical protein
MVGGGNDPPDPATLDPRSGALDPRPGILDQDTLD